VGICWQSRRKLYLKKLRRPQPCIISAQNVNLPVTPLTHIQIQKLKKRRRCLGRRGGPV
jgi:hypothetical protein